ncbi:MAG TPA: hypothetical protein VGB56_08980, partial [Flavisolibacter sp.]
MKKAHWFSLFTAFILFISTEAFAQRLDSLIQKHSSVAKQERLYLHYDKAAYSAGDTVWFKAYLMTEFFPSEESKTVYIDWLDEKGTLLHHSVAPVYEASTYGQFAVPANYKGQHIQVRAYTRWMLNFDFDFLYTKQIRILANAPSTSAKAKRQTTLQLMPEGGDAIEGLRTRIAFKATDQWGMPVTVSGSIVDGGGKSVQAFKTLHNGMGYFYLTPDGQTYSAKWKDDAGNQNTTPLPPVKQKGVSLHVSVSGSRRMVTIERPKDAAQRSFTLVGTMFGNQVFSTVADLGDKPTVTKVIPTSLLPTGILVITLFDEALNAVAERITFVKNSNYAFPTQVNVLRYGLNKRAKNDWELALPDSIEANISI